MKTTFLSLCILVLSAQFLFSSCSAEVDPIILRSIEKSNEELLNSAWYTDNYISYVASEKIRAKEWGEMSRKVGRGLDQCLKSIAARQTKDEIIQDYKVLIDSIDQIVGLSHIKTDSIELAELQIKDVELLKLIASNYAIRNVVLVREFIASHFEISLPRIYNSVRTDSIHQENANTEVYIGSIAANRGQNDWRLDLFELQKDGVDFYVEPEISTLLPQSVYHFENLPSGKYKMTFLLRPTSWGRNGITKEDLMLNHSTTCEFTVD